MNDTKSETKFPLCQANGGTWRQAKHMAIPERQAHRTHSGT